MNGGLIDTVLEVIPTTEQRAEGVKKQEGNSTGTWQDQTEFTTHVGFLRTGTGSWDGEAGRVT
jgi:hypothetical protein